jgi:hypothetical protein
MFTVFAVLNGQFSAADTNVVGDFNTVPAGGVVTFKGSGQMMVQQHDSLSAIIANGSGETPVDILLMAWGLRVKRLGATCGPTPCPSCL